MNHPKVLLIGADTGRKGEVANLLRRMGTVRLAAVEDLDRAYAYPDWDRVALVLIHHVRGGSTNGIVRLLRMLAATRRPVATLILGEGLDEATEAHLLRRGAAHCLLAPFDLSRLAYLVEILTLRARQVAGASTTAEAPAAWDESDPLVAQARRVASQDATVLVRGEAGTGKSRLARIIHDLSPRRGGGFVVLRCGSLTAEAFDDASDAERELPVSPTAAKLAEAREGTLVLDDVDALGPAAQVALLNWIEEGARESFGRPGGRQATPRVIATTRLPLSDEVASGRFRSGLYFRLNVIGLELPPLRLRSVEIVSMALSALAELAGRSVTLSPGAIIALEAYSWPGNIRELRQAMEAALAFDSAGRSIIERDALPEAIQAAVGRPAAARESGEADSTTLAETKREAEYHRITQALQKNGNNRLRTASELGISRMTLYKKLYKYGIIEPSGHETSSLARTKRVYPSPAPADDAGRDDGEPAPRPVSLNTRPLIGKSAPALH
ncbi:MAG TPA: sigma 54-interacting transcriptional regulator [Isosphaeraceae bacterium]